MGKPKAPPPPDFAPLAAAAERAAEIAAQLGREQLDFARTQYQEMSPLLRGIADSQIGMMDAQKEQGADYFNYMKDTFRPLEREFVQSARDFNTDAAREQQARSAAAEFDRAEGASRAANERSMASMGINPNSGRFAGVNRAAEAQMAAQRANAMTGARERAEGVGRALQLDAIGMGRGLPGASTAAYGQAVNAGTAGGNSAMAAGNQFMAAHGQGTNTMMGGINAQMAGLNNIANHQAGMYNTWQSNQESPFAAAAGIMQGVAALKGASDRRLKENIAYLGQEPKTGLPWYEFSYLGQETRYQGFMADEVERIRPDAVFEMESGHKAVRYDLLGVSMIKVQG